MDSVPDNTLGFVVLFVFICLSAFFSCSETALLSANKIRMRNLAEEGNKNAKTVLKLLSNTDSLLSTILVGNNLVNIGASSLSTVLAMDIFGSAGAGIATGALTIIILIFGEITPKSLAAKYADNICLVIASFINILVFILTPVVFILNLVTGLLLKILGVKHDISPTLTEEELKTYVTVSHEEGIIEEEEKEMIHNVFEFADTEIKEIMTPRIHVVSLDDDCTYEEVLSVYKEHMFSRIPVVNHDDRDDILGVLNMKDLILMKTDPQHFNVKDYLREPFVVYEFNHINETFDRMRENRTSSLAIVLDEYGVMSGIVTIEDIIEEIVGDIEDEYDEEEQLIKKIDKNTYLVDGTMNINELNDEIGTNFKSDDFESIGGLILGEIDTPELNRQIKIGRATFSVEKITKNRIQTLKIVLDEHENKENYSLE